MANVKRLCLLSFIRLKNKCMFFLFAETVQNLSKNCTAQASKGLTPKPPCREGSKHSPPLPTPSLNTQLYLVPDFGRCGKSHRFLSCRFFRENCNLSLWSLHFRMKKKQIFHSITTISQDSLENISNLVFSLQGHFSCQAKLPKWNRALLRLQ